MTLDDQLHDTFSSAVTGLEHPDRWQEVVTRGQRRRRHRRVAAVGSAAIALAGVVGLVVALTSGPTTTQVKIAPTHGTRATATTPASTAPTPTTATPRTLATAPPATATRPAVTTPPPSATTPAKVVPPRSATTAAPASPPPAKASSPAPYSFRYMPLYPFATQAQADAWLSAYKHSGVQPWHEDPGATALAFAAFLGYTEINKVTGSDITATQAHISVGYQITPSQPHTAAVIHLVRYGPSSDAPWEVVGTADQLGFTITSPAYGSTVRSPIGAGGQITGVDESITVQVLTLSSPTPVGRTCCHPAGGVQSPWSVSVPFNAAPGQVLIVSAATGGHVAAVERFVVTGVRN
jgi:hypothetical protein